MDEQGASRWLKRAITAVVLTSLLVAAWFTLPVVAPAFTISHSPWLLPVIRAYAIAGNAYTIEYDRRIDSWSGDVRPGIISALTTQGRGVRIVAARTLAGLEDPGDPLLFVHGLQDPEPEVRRWTARAINHHFTPDIVGPLLDRLDDSTFAVRWTVIGVLGDHHDVLTPAQRDRVEEERARLRETPAPTTR